MRPVLLTSALALALALPGPSGAQTLEQRFERWFGPPAERAGQGPARRPVRPVATAQAAPAPATVPTPSDRPDGPPPGEDETPPDAGPDATDQNAAADPSADEVIEAPEPDLDTVSSEALPTPEPRPFPDGGTAGEAEPSEPDAAQPLDPEPSEAPQPAYVPPERARTVPEESAPETPGFDVTPQESVEAARAVEDARQCEAELADRGAEFTVGASLSDGECGVLRPVSLTRTSSGVAVGGGTQMLCRTALAFDVWVADGVSRAAQDELGEEAPSAIGQVSTYVCRDRASERGISEHGRGSAIDIGIFEWEGRDPVLVREQEPGSAEDRFLAAIRRSACGPFRTVIGPGTDADHADHFHLDIAARANGSTYCR